MKYLVSQSSTSSSPRSAWLYSRSNVNMYGNPTEDVELVEWRYCFRNLNSVKGKPKKQFTCTSGPINLLSISVGWGGVGGIINIWKKG